jgi:peptidyl-prolyl cis-trans isomerase D
MITWIQTSLQKHFRILLFVLLAVVIVSFVFTIGAAPGIGQGGQKVRTRTYFDINLGSPEDQQRLFGDAGLSILLQAGFPALQGDQLQAFALQRYAALHLARQLNLPSPNSAQLTTFIQSLGAFADAEGNFDATAYARFRDNLRTDPNLTEADIARVLADDFRYDQVLKLLGGPGYVLDGDVVRQLARADSQWSIEVLSVDYTTFAPAITPTEPALETFFEANAFRYEIPPRVSVGYVNFPASAFLDRVTLTEQEIRNHYDANPWRFPSAGTGEDGLPTFGEDPADNFAAVRDQVAASLRLQRANRLAANAASDVTVAMFDAQVPAADIPAFLARRGLEILPAAPFTRSAVPALFGRAPRVGEEAFRLGPERPFSDALNIPGGAAILIWEETLPPEIPTLDQVREEVLADYVEREKRQRFLAAGRALRENIQTRLAAGESFATAATAAAAAAPLPLQVGATSHGPFTRRTPAPDVSPTVLGALENLDTGDLSEMVFSEQNGYLVVVTSRVAPDSDRQGAAFRGMRGQLAEFHSNQNATAYLAAMVESELARTAPVVR